MSSHTDQTIIPTVQQTEMQIEMSNAYLDYSLSVIISRALPDARDGLKPVQRRILFAMRKAGYDWSKPYKKSAGTVGDTMKTYHPHGNAPIYDAMVRMAQPFSLKLPLIDGQGNFGSLDGDPPAAERYTEARLALATKFMLHEDDMQAVPYENNYDNSAMMAQVLPVRFPNLLVNGVSGIAVGMATNIPPHNINETLDASCALLDNPNLTIEELMEYIPGPDFPLGGEICDSKGGILQAYSTGRGSFVLRGTYQIEEHKERERIIINTLPYQVNKAKFVESIASLVKDNHIDEIADLRDESNEEGIRIVIDVKKTGNAHVLVNKLINKTQLQVSVHFNMLAVLNQQPMQMNLKQLLITFIEFREDVIIQRTINALNAARTQAHKLWGLALALSQIDKIIACIKQAPDPATAEQDLQNMQWEMSDAKPFLTLLNEKYDAEQKHYYFTQEQAKAILELKLHRLTRLEFDKLSKDVNELAKTIAQLLKILQHRPTRIQLMKTEFAEVKKTIGHNRITTISNKSAYLDDEALIENDLMVVTLSLSGYIKRMNADIYRTQHRGGKGKSSTNLHEDDIASMVLAATNHEQMLFFSNLGKVYSSKVYQLPQASATSRGKAIVNILPIDYRANEKITSVTAIPKSSDHANIIFITESGKVRRNLISAFEKVPSTGKRAISANERLIDVMLANEEDDLVLTTKNGKAIRFNVDQLRVMQSRESAGVIGMNLKNDDQIVSALKISPNTDQLILTISERGYGKRTKIDAYRQANRGGMGVSTMDITKKTGKVLKSMCVSDEDEIILLTEKGQLIRIEVNKIRTASRDTQGVMLVRLDSDDKLVNATLVRQEEEEIISS